MIAGQKRASGCEAAPEVIAERRQTRPPSDEPPKLCLDIRYRNRHEANDGHGVPRRGGDEELSGALEAADPHLDPIS
jgi:hypothetical protein